MLILRQPTKALKENKTFLNHLSLRHNGSAMPKLLAVSALIVAIAGGTAYSVFPGSALPGRNSTVELQPSSAPSGNSTSILQAYQHHQSNLQVSGTGVVVKVLADDLKGSRHQRFILRLPSGITILIAHNIDLAPRLDSLRPGDHVRFNGEYEWNPKGGVVHWTHRDPQGRHVDGWLEHNTRRYQ
ncbi:Protein of unknown function [Amphritea atlantica]|uniref:DUF3465 domain-containing protein n=1 Tax=Amphritea atlantica TaxID=355243 RepID=A0A1H9IMF9_9GAMM|nr:DUF3465 domain-containing protein [Amphritea atlantica]SEQ75793.1 Protein of unknown function [Amphritea atlantica]